MMEVNWWVLIELILEPGAGHPVLRAEIKEKLQDL